jgi:nitrate reductase (cytochrome), electron transfer subunit
MKHSFFVALGLFSLVALFTVEVAADAPESLRGGVGLDRSSPEPTLKKWQPDRPPIPRDYVQQPPLIPHSIEGYTINRSSNKCLSCHSWTNYIEAGATKISQTHFSDRDASVMANVAARRYFCTQCHVPQVEAAPIVGNDFQPLRSVREE